MNKVYAAKSGDVQKKSVKIVEVNGMEIGLYRIDNRVYAWRNICPHAGAPICQGLVSGTTLPTDVYEYAYGKEQQILRCPWHGWEFDLKTGKHLVEQSKTKLKGYEVVEEDETIYLVFRSNSSNVL